MRPFEYALVLISILMGLALADIVVSLHRLIRSREIVKWDGRVLIATSLVMLEIIRMWFAQWTGRDLATALTFGVYLGEFVQILLLVLLAFSSLPDRVTESCDLGDFYDANRRYFWSIFAAYQASYFVLWLTSLRRNAGHCRRHCNTLRLASNDWTAGCLSDPGARPPAVARLLGARPNYRFLSAALLEPVSSDIASAMGRKLPFAR